MEVDNAMKQETETRLQQLLTEYYQDYYHRQLGLPDYPQRVQLRLKEDESYFNILERVKVWWPELDKGDKAKKVLIVGTGTGQEFVNFNKLGYDVYGIEVEEEAIRIVDLKCELYGYPMNRVEKAPAENLPFADNYFDIVWSWYVLEHVQDIDTSFAEIYRVLKPGGRAGLFMPDTRQFWEGHYKLYLPMLLPRFILSIWIWLKRRPSQFLRTGINKITTGKVRNIVQHLGFDSTLLFHHWSQDWIERRKGGMNLVYWMTKLTGIQRDQWWLLRKRD